jgi:hypothetical protein
VLDAPKGSDYIQGLKLWYEFMNFAAAEKGEWSAEATLIRPRPAESADQWLERCWDDIEPWQEHPVVHHKTREEMSDHWDSPFHELHVTLNCEHFTRAEIETAIGKLLDDHMKNPSRRGRPSSQTPGRQRAFLQPNTNITNQDTLAKLEYMRKTHAAGTGNLEVAAVNVLGDDEVSKDRDSALRRVTRYRHDAKALVNAVRDGKFPDPGLPANGVLLD